MKYITSINHTDYEIELLDEGRVSINGRISQVSLVRVDQGSTYSLLLDGRSFAAFVLDKNDHLQVFIYGVPYAAEVLDQHEKLLRQVSSGVTGLDDLFTLIAPMPGLVISVPVTVGQVVSQGDVLVILESMKMQNELRAPQSGFVKQVFVEEGGSVEKRDVIMVLGPVEEGT